MNKTQKCKIKQSAINKKTIIVTYKTSLHFYPQNKLSAIINEVYCVGSYHIMCCWIIKYTLVIDVDSMLPFSQILYNKTVAQLAIITHTHITYIG